ncbi:hypothetical protein ASPCAL04985 [Aspergillus calidoustus]|uniref:Zn(2)-C6 fungal-type domain-containing protein n=1 Tax=Aspergillus calidoustus TaxID=454130 RepID=A0A0U4Z2F0_ASPCI|nr:hypothetical protein ASPCAL04985 [Aspergillus calidoustus]
MVRKPHKKSRLGCIECKRRHIKCDEGRPICGNCNISRRDCSYASMISEAHIILEQFPRTSTSAGTADKQRPSDSPNPSQAGSDIDSPPVNPLHLELFHHFVQDLSVSLGLDRIVSGSRAIGLMGSMLAAPYLMDQILAFSALHLSILRRDQQKHYKYHADQLQTHAISAFNGLKLEVNPENCLPLFMFASCLANHTLCEKLVFRADSFDGFVDDFVQCLRLHCGIRTITSQSWHFLLETPLKDTLRGAGQALDEGPPGDECLELLSLVNTTVSDSATRKTYHQAIESLQKTLNANRVSSNEYDAMSLVVSWPVMVPPAYSDRLAERQPEALVILAYYAALVHMHSDIWLFGDSGSYILRSVNGYLGPSWEQCLRWPNEILQSYSGASEMRTSADLGGTPVA